jgi:hypothetical protein
MMLQLEEEWCRHHLKEVAQVELVLAKIPMKALYRLQVSVTQEIQSRARVDVTDLAVTKDGKEALQVGTRAGQDGDTGGEAVCR